MTVKIFIINLKSSTERREFIQKQLLKVDLESEFIEACESHEISNEELRHTNLNCSYIRELTKEEIACATSHAKALAALGQDESCAHGLIIEDDVYLSRNLPRILAQLEQLHKPEDVILLCGLIFKPTELQYDSELCLGYGLTRPDHYKIHGAQAYFLSREKAKAFSGQLLPVVTVADDWKTFLDRRYFSQLYCVYPFPVLHAEFMSVRNIPDSAGLRSAIKKLIIKYRIFPLYQIFFAIRRRNAEYRQRRNIHAPNFKRKKTYKI